MADPQTMLLLFETLALVVFVVVLCRRYHRCPPDKILVIYGASPNGAARCLANGGAFVWPLIQDYAYLSLTPFCVDAKLANVQALQDARVDVSCRFTVGISTEPELMPVAAKRLLGLAPEQIQNLAQELFCGQLRLMIAQKSVEELKSNRRKLHEDIFHDAEADLKKVGLKLINVSVIDVRTQ